VLRCVSASRGTSPARISPSTEPRAVPRGRKMVPTAGVEPAQVAPLAPQTSASTNFATSARPWASPNSYGVRGRTPSIQRRFAPVRKPRQKLTSITLEVSSDSVRPVQTTALAQSPVPLVQSLVSPAESRGQIAAWWWPPELRAPIRWSVHRSGARPSTPASNWWQRTSRQTPPSVLKTGCSCREHRTPCPTHRNRIRLPLPRPYLAAGARAQ
jgi:hypothetical protein